MRPSDQFDVGAVAVRVAATDHRPVEPTVAYRIESDGRSAVLGGDGVPCASIDELCNGADAYVQSVIREACERHDLLAERQRLLDELRTKNEELEKANALKQAFIEVASHELRTPLTILSGLVGLSLRVQSLGDPLKDWLKRIDQAGQRLQTLGLIAESQPACSRSVWG